MGSRKLPGNDSDTEDIKLTVAPNKKNTLRAVIPAGRVLDLVVIGVVACRLTAAVSAGFYSSSLLSVRTNVRMELKLTNFIRIHFQSAACLRIRNLCTFSA